MKQLYKVLLLLIITTVSLQAQQEKVFSKVFETDKNTTAIFNLEYDTVVIEISNDNKIHFNCKAEFANYSKKEMDSMLKNYNIEATMFENNVTLRAVNKNLGGYIVDEPYQAIILNHMSELSTKNAEAEKNSHESNNLKKSKDLIIEEINKNNGYKSIDEFLIFFKSIDKKGKDITKKNVKAFQTHFVIKLPPYVKLNINGIGANITFKDDVKNELFIDLDRGFFKAKTLSNPHNKIKTNYLTRFKVEEINGGDYILNNIQTGKIGSIKDAKITSEFSKIKVGEIQNNVTITDYNSVYWFYNWSKDFTRFDLFSEYSKIHYFYPETNYSLKVVGNNTVNHIDKVKIEMQPTKNGEKFRMMERKATGKGAFSGVINFDIVHGIIYSYNDTFIPNKN